MESSFNFTIPRERPLSEAMAGMPRAFKEQAQKGFRVLAGVEKQHYAEILKVVVSALESRRAPLDDLEKPLGLSRNDLSGLFAAAMLVVPLLGEGGSVEEFATAATKIELIPADILSGVRPFLEIVVAERLQISRAIRRATIPAQVLPFIAGVDIVVDLRMAFEEQSVVEAVPVAVIHLDTDADGQEIWFQASKRQLEQLRADIDKAIKRLDAAETWTQRPAS